MNSIGRVSPKSDFSLLLLLGLVAIGALAAFTAPHGLPLFVGACLLGMQDAAPAPAAAEYLTISTRDPNVELNCRVSGKLNGEPIVVLHGGPGFDHRYLLYKADGGQNPFLQLEHDFKLIFYDQRATGLSTTPADGQITLDKAIEDVEDICKRLSLGAIHLIGHSWGGLLAMHFAAKCPERIRSLVIVNSTPLTSQKDYENFKEKRNSREGADSWEGLVGASFFDKKYVPGFSSLFTDKNKVDKEHNWACLKRDAKNYKRHAGILQQILCPVLVIYGTDDLVPVSYYERLAENIRLGNPNVYSFGIKKAGHYPFMESPIEFFEVVSRFLHSDFNVNGVALTEKGRQKALRAYQMALDKFTVECERMVAESNGAISIEPFVYGGLVNEKARLGIYPGRDKEAFLKASESQSHKRMPGFLDIPSDLDIVLEVRPDTFHYDELTQRIKSIVERIFAETGIFIHSVLWEEDFLPWLHFPARHLVNGALIAYNNKHRKTLYVSANPAATTPTAVVGQKNLGKNKLGF